MSNLLWKYYLEDDVEKFRRLLANAGHSAQYTSKGHGGGTVHGNNSYGSLVGSPGGFATSPRTVMKNRKASGQMGNQSATKGGNPTIGRAELNSRDHAGLTVLHRCVSSTSENAISFAIALIEHPYIDLYVQDIESGWTALHRALYHGNITIARAIINRDARDPTVPVGNAIKSVIKVKDHEGNSPFDVYNATIARRTLQHRNQTDESDDESENDDAESISPGLDSNRNTSHLSVDGDELFLFGSNKNLTLGFGDQDDRQHPEKIILKRPDHLLFRFYREHAESLQGTAKALHNLAGSTSPKSVSELPSLIQNRPIIIQDVALSKLHSAILTTDPESNLYTCGFGPGGRLGTGDEVTRFTFVCIEQGGLVGKKVVSVALGQNHTLAVDSEGEIFSWGTNSFGQLGYTLPRPSLKDEEPMCSTPRQIFGPLKKESIIGVAASAIHSVAHTSTSLYTWGKNEGQLGLMGSDSGSLKAQLVPRKVAASLFKSSIVMVSAINRATICLLANHTVCVFTNYGYNIVKFPLHEGFSNYYLNSATLTTRYEAESNHISSITSGGDTIAAVSSRGDLFTITVSQKLENPTATSTTNPSKIKGSLSAPQRVWSLRKGNWDGIKSVGVAENGTVIVCTQAGAVWRRVKRAKIKDAYTGSGDFSRKDFKFQRVPGLTKVAAVRSNTFGVYAAIRKDSDVTKAQVLVDDKTLWKDIAPLLSIRSLQATELQEQEKDTTPRFWVPALPKDHFDPLKRAVLMSPDIEGDVGRHLFGLNIDEEGYDVEIYSTTSEIRLPVHGFMLAARSPVLRHALSDFRLTGTYTPSEVFIIERDPGSNLTKIIFSGLDFLTILNLVIYCYTDTVVDVWHFTRHSPPLAFRYRQVRTELMKAAALLKMVQLEAAARLMSEPEQQMDVDMALAVQDPDFLENGDAIIELEEGAELVAHSALLCQRCPFFQGLFNGRAGGRWLAGRREEDSTVRVDLKHIYAGTFQLVLRYIYSDCGTELFDDVVSEDIDEFCELVLDVLAVANELMLDRLSQICQQVIGRFVNTRNVCNLVNEVAPCAVTEFKDAGLEYLCLQLESMLENHQLDDLEEDLLLELDEVVRANQLNCLPFVKSGRAELLLHQRHPSLAQDIDEERQRRIRDMAFRTQMKEEDYRLSSSFRARGSVDDILSGSPSNEKARRKSKATRNAPFSPSIRPKDSMADLMFDMDDDDTLSPSSPVVSPLQRDLDFRTSPGMGATHSKDAWGKTNVDNSSNQSPILPVPTDLVLGEKAQSPKSSSKTWSSPVLPSTKLDMREIMAQASSSRTSNLSMSISAQKTQVEAAKKAAAPKLSQKERKKQQALQQSVQPCITIDTIPSDGKLSSPWQVATGPKTSLKEVLDSGSKGVPSVTDQLAPSPAPSKTLPHRRAPSPDTRFSGQRKVPSNTGSAQTSQKSSPGPSRTTSQPHSPKPVPLIPHSKSYTTTAKAEPSLQLSMADIIGQQQREQEVIKEAVAKRSLQEIQEEQAFQEWWDQESKRAQEEEEAAKARAIANVGKASSNAKGKGGARGRGGRGRGEGKGRGKGKSQEKGVAGN